MTMFDVLRTASKETVTMMLTAYISAAISGEDMAKMAALHDAVQRSVINFLDLEAPDEPSDEIEEGEANA